MKFIWGEKEAVVGNNLYQEIFNTYSDNTISRNVEIKIIILNYYESIKLKMQANKITVKELADFISNLPNVNERIKNDYTSIASEIAVNKGNIFLLSLASKYCFYQNRYAYGKNDYSIYDSVVHQFLSNKKFPSADKYKLSNDKKEKYQYYKSYIDKVINSLGLHNALARDIFDALVWRAYKLTDENKRVIYKNGKWTLL